MKKTVSTLFLVTLALGLGCKYLRSDQKIESESADANPPRAISDTRITLNNDSKGTVNDLDALRNHISPIMEVRRDSLVFKAGTNEVENTVFLFAGPNIPVKNLAETAMAINESGGKAYLLKSEKSATSHPIDARPYPLTLVARIGSAGPTFEQVMYRDTPIQKYACSPTFEIVSDRRDIKFARRLGNSVEISADDRFFVNAAADISESQDENDIKVNQRAVDSAQLKNELPNVLQGKDVLKIIVSENASYKSLEQLFAAADSLNIEFDVIVRRIEQPKK